MIRRSGTSLDRLSSSAKSKLLELISKPTLPRREDMDLAVRELLLVSPIKKEEAALQALSVGQGAWEVSIHCQGVGTGLGCIKTLHGT